MSEVTAPGILLFQIHRDACVFLGNENVISATSDFGHIWDRFFRMGGYDPILPYATDPRPINAWYTNSAGQAVYSQGLFVNDVEHVPAGYTLVRFPASEYLVVTTEWMETNEEAVGENGNGRCNSHADIVQMPEGYARNDGPGSFLSKLEKENADTPDGSRYEVWVPIRKR